MLNIKITESMKLVPQFLPLTTYISLIYIYIFDYFISVNFEWQNLVNFINKSWITLMDNNSSLYLLGTRLWEHSHAIILLASLLLLFSMIAAIMLTLKPKEKIIQDQQKKRIIKLVKINKFK